MREIKYIVLGSIIILGLEGIYFLGPKEKSRVLSENVEMTIAPTVTPIPTDSPTPTPMASASLTTIAPKLTPVPTKTPTPVPVPAAATSAEINGFIDRFSSQYSVDPNVLRHMALCESGFNSSAVNGNYVGLYQFAPTTWKNIRKEMGEDENKDLRFSAEESVQTAAYAFSKGKTGIWPNCNP
jgi:hypothetical protein